MTLNPTNEECSILTYADAIGIRFVGILGEQEIDDETVTVKNMESGEQESIKKDSLSSIFK